MKKYLEEGRIKVDKSIHHELTTYHDPCNYGRKSEMVFGKGYYDEPRWIMDQCVENWVEMSPHASNAICCGAGGGAWAMPYNRERLDYGKWKADQIKATGAKMVVAPCHNCRDQILKGLTKEYNLGIETKYLWELVSDSLIIEPWSEDEIKKSHEERDKQYERDDIDLEEKEY
jgi:Fe-S oxidoreductase